MLISILMPFYSNKPINCKDHLIQVSIKNEIPLTIAQFGNSQNILSNVPEISSIETLSLVKMSVVIMPLLLNFF